MHSETGQNSNSAADATRHVTDRSGAYAFPVDAVVLAGTHQNAKRLIAGRNKAFLKVSGKLLFRYVVDALLEAESIGQIFVVGPAEELLEELEGYAPKVKVIAQRGKMLTNLWAGIEASEDCHRHDPVIPVHDRPLLVISCDLPLVTGRSIDDFVAPAALMRTRRPRNPMPCLQVS